MRKNRRNEQRRFRRQRVRAKVRGTDAKPRLCVFRSLRYTYAQLISDESGTTLACASTKELQANSKAKSARNVETAKELGQAIARLAKEKNIREVIFDRNGFLFHGRVKAVAEGAREAGLAF